MNRAWLFFLLAVFMPAARAQNGVELMDDHTFVHLMVDELEFVDVAGEGDLSWDIDLLVGGDLKRAWIKTRGARSDAADRSEVQALYSQAVLPFWDLQAGIRHDLDPTPDRDWAVLSVRGLAPYFFQVEAELFFAEGGQTSVRARAQYDLLLTQRLILSPELELSSYGRDEPSRSIGSGLGEIELNVRLRYEIKREIAPYVGLGWHRLYRSTRDYARVAGRDEESLVISIGIRGWF